MKEYILVSMFFVLLAVPACKSPDSAGVDNSKPKETAADTSDPNAKAEFLKTARKFTELPFVTAKVDRVMTYDGKDVTYSRQIEFAAPNRTRIKPLDDNGDQLEYIAMGKTVYVGTCSRCPGGIKWDKLSEDGGPVDVMAPFRAESLRRLSDVKFDGEETIDGKKTSVYSYQNQVFMGLIDKVDFMTVSSCKVWVRQDKGVPVKLHADFSNSPVKSLDIVFDVEKSVKIEAPVVSAPK